MNSRKPKLFLTDTQKRGYDFIASHNYSICAVDMGLGKSALSLKFSLDNKLKTLIVCPAYLTLNWEAEINKWDWGTQVPGIAVVKAKKDIAKIDKDKIGIVIVSYSNIIDSDHLFEWAGCVIFDEGQNLKSMSAKRTQSIHRMVYENSIPRLIILTGTPIKNRVEEFYSLISLCYYNPSLEHMPFLKKYEDSISFANQFSFKEEFKMKVVTKKGAEFEMPILRWSGVRNIPELKEILKPIYFRAKGEPGSYVMKEVVIGDENCPELLEAFKDEDLDIKKVRPPEKVKAAMYTVNKTVEYVKAIQEETGSPVVVYSDHREPAKAIAEALKVDKAATGEVKASDRMEMVLSFNKDTSADKYLVATVKALSEGANLTRSYNLVFNDLPWSAGELLQVIKRIDRMGQKNRPVIHILHGTRQTKEILKRLMEKLEVLEKAT